MTDPIDVLAEAYADLFDENDVDVAVKVMTDLATRFGYAGQSVYDPNEQNAGTNAVYRGGQQSVLQHIVFMVNKGKQNANSRKDEHPAHIDL